MAKSSLNPEQRQAVTHGTGPLLIIAGAGTGKTTVITERIKYLLVEKNIPASEILALTFTEKAAQEMEERIDVALPYGFTNMWIATFHAFCDRILRDEAVHIGLTPSFRIVTEAEAMLFLRKNLHKFDLDYFRPLGNPYKFIQGILTHFSRLKDDDITPDDYAAYAKKLEKESADPDEIKKTHELSQAYVLYEKLKAQEGIMDFADLNANVLRLFRTRKNVLSYYQKKFKYILVDEFQDTNYAQNELAIMLAGDKQNITVVGDDDQAIYRWRGAALANIIQFKDHFPNAKTVTLINNYRSTREILNTSYKLIQHNNPDRLEVREKINKQLLSMRDIKGETVSLLFGRRVEQEAELAVEKIKELTGQSSKGRSNSGGKKLRFLDIAILVRANDHAQPFTRALERAEIPYQFLGPGQLFHQEEIKDLIAYLKVMANFEDSASLYRVITHPHFAIDARDIAALLNTAKKQNLTLFETLEKVDSLSISNETKETITQIVTMIQKHLKRVPRDTAGQILYYFFDDSGLMKKFLNPDTALSEKQVQNIARFFEKLKSYEAANNDSSVFAIVDWIDLSMQLGESPLAADVDWTENNAVNILTIHSSKGLEFPAVFVTNLVTQRFPTRNRKDQIPIPDELVKEALPDADSNISEERRLFYVAMTRAKDYLFLTAAHYYGEGKRERKLSPFVYEALGESYVNSVLQKKKAESHVHQLSLIDVLSENLVQPEGDHTQHPVTNGVAKPLTFISYSQICTFEACPLHYKLRYLLRIPPFPTASLSFGSSVHAVLRDYFQIKLKLKSGDYPSVKSLLAENWLKEGYTSKSHEQTALSHAEKIITRYIEQYKDSTPIATEVPFQFSIGDLKVGGRIDRIDSLPDGRLEIIDYKTGNTVCDDKQLAKDVQLTIYALAATTINDTLFNKQPEEVVLSLYYLDKDIKLTTTRTKEQLEKAKEYLLEKADLIAKSDFVCSVKNCKACEYHMLCKTYAD